MTRNAWLGTVLLLAAGIVLLQAVDRSDAGNLAGPARVIDGDTLAIGGQRVRIIGVDAPETRQICRNAARQGWPCGVEAAEAMRAHLGQDPVSCRLAGRDRYGRDLGECALEGHDLGSWLVRQGWAIPFGDRRKVYEAQRRAAQASRRGLWAGPFDRPADWRRTHARHREDRLAP